MTLPQAYGERVKHALDAEATSVKLSNLVGQGGLWYGFGRLIMNEYSSISVIGASTAEQICLDRLDDDSPDAQQLSDLLSKVCRY